MPGVSGQFDRTVVNQGDGEELLGGGCTWYVGLSPLCLPPSLQLRAPGAPTHLQASRQWQSSAKVA